MTHIMSVHPGVLCFHHVMLTWDHALTTPRFSAAISVLPEKTETVQGKIAGSFPEQRLVIETYVQLTSLERHAPLDVTRGIPKNMQRLSSPLIGCNYHDKG